MIKWVTDYLASVRDSVAKAARDEIVAQTPNIIRAVVTAIAETGGHLAEDTVDKVTDAIPGTLDDDILDGIVGNVLNRLGIKI